MRATALEAAMAGRQQGSLVAWLAEALHRKGVSVDKLLRACDPDRSGDATFREFCDALRGFGIHASDAAMLFMFNQMDVDSDHGGRNDDDGDDPDKEVRSAPSQ